ncbi:3'-5' exonuclease family protein [Actimicrobium antarcticum]|uniref:Excinuclease cho n=1 Tax=Actimicrobium antarcticum TaxID=1051899 RepID=A0ABP7TQ29_9BURK
MAYDPARPRLAFVDLETTGATATIDRITEVGIVEVDEDGTVREWSSLVNPQRQIPEFIEGLTGISNAMVATAPGFGELAAEIFQRLEGRVFLAHNARFDHGFLRNEFKRVGIDFRPTVLCTVKLSRKLYPEFARHNLDTLAERHQLHVTERHRALGDAQLIWQFWQTIHATLPHERIQAVVKELIARPSLPSYLDASLLDDLPSTHGVYLFFDDSQLPLYVGKANNLRRRVLSHFSGDHASPKEMQLSQQIRRVEWIETAGELGALLREAALIKKLSPAHNRQLRRNDQSCAWRLVQQGDEWQIALVNTADLFFGDEPDLFGPFATIRKATTALKALATEHQLCHALLGLEKVAVGKPCFGSQVAQCKGVCIGRESAASHTARFRLALEGMRMKAWPYAGPIGLREGDAMHIISNWSYLGTVDSEVAAWEMIEQGQPSFDRDVYHILHKKLGTMPGRIHKFF